MQKIIEQLINGLTVGSFYALIALGYTMVYGVLSMINFAHGDIFMVGAYFGCFTITQLSKSGFAESNPALAIIYTFAAGALGAALTGVTVERLAYRPLRKASRLSTLISAIGTSIFLEEFVRLVPKFGSMISSIHFGEQYIFPASWRSAIVKVTQTFGGAMVKAYPGILGTEGIKLGGVSISYSRILIMAVAIVFMVLLYLLVRFTKLGKAMRAVSEDKETASLMGINVNRIISSTFFIGSALAGIAGVMMGIFYLQIRTTMGFTPGIKAFTAAVVGGIGNIPGAMLGGYLLGLAEVISVQFLPAVYKDIVAFAILIVMLIVKPTGILGGSGGKNKL
ncbi:MAG: branched-chain amino acid ABC transporter permease [Pelolinea sp.]|jgi:branched-chain amino acid transport system permease protein|nr:branched-chain amino acid ABC transporter permease [Pelolinea sp.]